MFDNVGSKIKEVAQLFSWLGIIASTIAGLIVMFISEDTPWPGFLIIVAGCIVSWLSSLTLYGFGQLVENSDILVKQAQNQLGKSEAQCKIDSERISKIENLRSKNLISEEEYQQLMSKEQ